MPRSLQAISSSNGGPLSKPETHFEGILTPLLARLSPGLGATETAAPLDERRPVHTVYGGAHLFTHDVAQRLGRAALIHLDEWAPDFVTFARAVRLPGSDRLPTVTSERAKLVARFGSHAAGTRAAEPHAHIALSTWERMRERLTTCPVEDYRIDFEDGFGFRSDAEEDERAGAVAEELSRGLAEGTLPPGIGIRIKPFTADSVARAARTLELVVGAVAGAAGRLPDSFVVTLPKVTRAAQVSALADCCEALERRYDLAAGVLRVELMVETPESVIAPDGTVPLRALVAAARGRCRGVHFGAYDYTAACGIAAAHQTLSHPACVLARQILRTALAGTDVALSDGAVTTLPVGPNRAGEGGRLTPRQLEANRAAVHEGWRVHFDEVRRALREGFDQGWDLHPGQLATRHAAVISFYLEARDEAAARLAAFVERAALASRHGSIMEDAATGQGLLNFFLRGLACGALVESDALGTGLTLEEIRGRSFARIAERRAAQPAPASGAATRRRP